MADYDLAVVGGGINGTGIARDAAGRGIKVLLVEQHDLASGTSSASTKLIHGGLRYLEHYAFRLVREALIEREVLWRMAPHLVRPMRFVLPHHAELRPAWMLRLGLFLYDHLGGRKLLPGTAVVDLTTGALGVPLKRQFRLGFEYSDCQVDDARLVVLNAVDAAERGATIRTRTRLTRAERADGHWRLVLNSRGRRETVTARVLVNAAGPWVGHLADTAVRLPGAMRVRLVKGSHIVVRRLFEHDRAYMFQHGDGRIVFAIPYETDFTLVGTTDLDFDGDPSAAICSPAETTYLCQALAAYVRRPVDPEQVVKTFSGVRPLYDDGSSKAQEATRDYVLALDAPPGAPPLLTVYGGKLTTYRRLAEAAMARLGRYFGARRPWTAGAPLPGGDFPVDGVAALVERARARWPFLTERSAARLVGAYGTRLERVFEGVADAETAGPWFGPDLCAAEVRHLMTHEWAETADDVLWRRSKLALRLDDEQAAALDRFMQDARGRIAAAE